MTSTEFRQPIPLYWKKQLNSHFLDKSQAFPLEQFQQYIDVEILCSGDRCKLLRVPAGAQRYKESCQSNSVHTLGILTGCHTTNKHWATEESLKDIWCVSITHTVHPVALRARAASSSIRHGKIIRPSTCKGSPHLSEPKKMALIKSSRRSFEEVLFI